MRRAQRAIKEVAARGAPANIDRLGHGTVGPGCGSRRIMLRRASLKRRPAAQRKEGEKEKLSR